MYRTVRIVPVYLTLALLVSACSSFGPPQSCGENVGGVADETLYGQYFNAMELVSQESGLPGQDGENGAQFAAGEALELRVDSKMEVAVRACVQPRGPGELRLDQTVTLPAGEGIFTLGGFDTGNLVIRVIVDDTLVKNFPFEIK